MNAQSKKTTFFIAGAPKAGTTSLYHYLDSHPAVCMSSLKEPNYFSATDLHKEELYYDEAIIDAADQYEELFSHCSPDAIRGEASVSYLYYNDVPKRIHQYNADAKIIILLRDPSTRAFSHWLMDERLGFVSASFEDILDRKSMPGLEKYFTQYIRLGFYYKQVKRYIDQFGADQVLIFLQDDLRNDSDVVMRKLYSFLNIAPLQLNESQEEHNSARRINNPMLSVLYRSKFIRKSFKAIMPARLSQKMMSGISSADDRKPSVDIMRKLAALYRDDIQQLSKLINRDLRKWNQ